jgi:hypothetical protein
LLSHSSGWELFLDLHNSTLKMEVACSSETSIYAYKTIRSQNPHSSSLRIKHFAPALIEKKTFNRTTGFFWFAHNTGPQV